MGDYLKFTFEIDTPRNIFLEVQAHIDANAMKVNLYGIENYYGSYVLSKISQH